RGFGSGDRDRENCEHHAGWLMRLRSETPECDEIQIRRGQHQLDADEDKNRVPPAQRRQEPDGKQARGNDEKGLKRGCHRNPGRKRPTPNVQRPTSNSESLPDSALSVERWALSVCFTNLNASPPSRELARL